LNLDRHALTIHHGAVANIYMHIRRKCTMKQFMNEDFLLNTDTARQLYHGIAENLPIIDYHCHLSPREIAEDRRFANIAEAWLYGDHYKWRVMRSNGVEERLVTGPADDYDRFMAWSATMPMAIGNPLFHWTHLELKRYFGIDDILTPRTAPGIWKRANEVLAGPDMGAQGLITRSNVKVICTTDDPADSLQWHKQIAQQGKLACKVYPAWRPDKALNVDKPGFAAYIAALGTSAGVEIKSWDSLLAALDARLAFFHSMGCRLSDHGFEQLPYDPCQEDEAATILEKALKGIEVTEHKADHYRTALMLWLGRRYAELGWTMQLHIGATRNNNTRLFGQLGPDTGFDAAADHELSRNLSSLLNGLEQEGKLPRTIVYTLNPKDNYVISSVLGCFQNGGIAGKMQFGAAWWYTDHRDGMEQQMRDLANTGLLSQFVGMLTDSRSFLSYTRHEYFRRIFCNMLGQWVEDGECPDDMTILEPIVRGVCHENAERYFGFGL
jgi:glucuronate isomerase